MDSLIVGLGNPGEKYKNTRHNLGFILLDRICSNFKPEKKFKSEVSEVQIGASRVLCIKPQTYMNLSGEAVQAVMSFYQIDPENCLVLHDELDLAFGTVRIKFGGGEGGHNGLKSISQHLGTKDYARIRLGIGKPEPGNLIAMEDWVLQRFSAVDKEKLEDFLETGKKAVNAIFEKGLSKAQNMINSLAAAS